MSFLDSSFVILTLTPNGVEEEGEESLCTSIK